MKYYFTIIITLCFLHLNAQTKIDSVLNQINTLNKNHGSKQIFFLDKYNCILDADGFEIQLKYSTIIYEFQDWDKSHSVRFSPPENSKIMLVKCKICTDPTQAKEAPSYSTWFDTKENAFKAVNLFNELLFNMKSNGYCKQ